MQISKMPKKKVLNIIYSGFGGHGSVWYSLMNGGGLLNWDNYVVFYGIEDLNPDYELFCNNNNIPFLFLKKESKVDFINWFRLLKFVLKNRITNVIQHQHNTIFAFILLRLSSKFKLIYVDHTTLEILKFIDKFFRNSSLLFCNFSILINELQHKGIPNFINKNKVKYIPNGIDNKIFKPNVTFESKSMDPFKVGMASRICHPKDFITLINAVKILSKNYDIQLHIAGIGEDFEKVKDYIITSKSQDIVFLRGLITRNELTGFYNEINVFVLSSFSECMPMVLLEAMACKTPVIGSNVRGINEIIINEQNGLLFEFKDEIDLSNKIEMLINNKIKTIELINNGYYTATQVFSMENMFNKYNNLIQK